MQNARIRRLMGIVGSFFSSHAWLSLFTLLVMLGLVLGLTNVSRKISQNTAASSTVLASVTGTRSAGAFVAPTANCGQILVFFRPDSAMSQVTNVLQQVDAFIAFGPNENQAYEIHVDTADLVGVQKALEQSSAVAMTSLNLNCKK